MEQKATVAHLKFNYMHKVGNQRNGDTTVQEGYNIITIPGEGSEIQEKMRLAIINYGMKLGLFNIETISPEEYNKAKEKHESNTQIQKQ